MFSRARWIDQTPRNIILMSIWWVPVVSETSKALWTLIAKSRIGRCRWTGPPFCSPLQTNCSQGPPTRAQRRTTPHTRSTMSTTTLCTPRAKSYIKHFSGHLSLRLFVNRHCNLSAIHQQKIPLQAKHFEDQSTKAQQHAPSRLLSYSIGQDAESNESQGTHPRPAELDIRP